MHNVCVYLMSLYLHAIAVIMVIQLTIHSCSQKRVVALHAVSNLSCVWAVYNHWTGLVDVSIM